MLQTFDGSDPAQIRQQQVSQTQAHIFVEENGCEAGALAHTTEVVGVLVVDLGIGAVPPPPGHNGGGH